MGFDVNQRAGLGTLGLHGLYYTMGFTMRTYGFMRTDSSGGKQTSNLRVLKIRFYYGEQPSWRVDCIVANCPNDRNFNHDASNIIKESLTIRPLTG